MNRSEQIKFNFTEIDKHISKLILLGLTRKEIQTKINQNFEEE